MRGGRYILCLPALLVLACFLMAAPNSYAEKKNKKNKADAFFGVIRKDDRGDVARLREILESIETSCPKIPQKCAVTDELYDELFGDLNNRNLPIVVVYLDDDLQVRTNHLIWRRKVTPFVFGVQNVWVFLIAEKPVAVEAQLTNLYDGHTGIAAAVRNIFISSGRRTLESREAQELTKELELKPWNQEPAGQDNLWYAVERFYVDIDSAYRISLQPADEATQDAVDFERIDVRLTNSRRRALDFGIGIGFTGDISDEDLADAGDFSGVRTENGIMSLYWMMQAYIRRPTLLDPIGRRVGSRYRVSYAVTFGFNLDIFNVDQIILGLNIGHLFGRNGIVIGANFFNPLDDQQDATIKPFFGVNFNF